MVSNKQLAIICTIWLGICSFVLCDLSLFEKDTQEYFKNIDENAESDQYNKLYLFPNSNQCHENAIQSINKKAFCSDHCAELYEEKIKNSSNNCSTISVKNEDQDTLLNISGIIFYYKSFVTSLLSEMKLQSRKDSDIENSKFELKFELDNHGIQKLKDFIKSNKDSETLLLVQDTTDVLMSMFINIQSTNFNEYKTNRCIDFSQIDSRIYWLSILTIFCLVYVFFLRHKFPNTITIKNIIIILILGMFVLSVIKNHKYLNQKKQVLKEQRLKEAIPAECLIDKDGKKPSGFVSYFRHFLGYTATSRQCLEYHEALYIDSEHNNYVETVTYTLTESIRPFAAAIGEFINNFYSALTKDLSMYQYMPLIAGVTIIGVPFIIVFIMLVFGYEFNFFHLISFRKSQTPTTKEQILVKETTGQLCNDQVNAQLLALIARLNSENEKLVADNKKIMIESSQKLTKEDETTPKTEFKQLIAIEQNLNEEELNNSLVSNLDAFISNINTKEEEYINKIKGLEAENQKLKNAVTPSKSDVLNQRQSELLDDSNEEKENIQVSTPVNINSNNSCKVVNIGLSKTVLGNKINSTNDVLMQTKSNLNLKKTKERELLQESNDSNTAFEDTEDDEDNDIFVILEDNN